MNNLIKKQKENFKNKFCTVFGIPVVVDSGVLSEQYQLLNTRNADDVYNWHINSVRGILSAELDVENEKLQIINNLKSKITADEIVPSFVAEVLLRERIERLKKIISELE